MTGSYRYAAFISYSSKDAAFAGRLHKALETYRIPSALGTFKLSDDTKVKNRVYPIFRDREEMAGGQLDENVRRALHDSGALIVVCSPNAAQSDWVAKEIDAFEKSGRPVFGVIVSGEPHASERGDVSSECFPVTLRRAHRAALGLSEIVAGDARREHDGFRRAWMKVVAGLLGVTLGALIDRDRQRSTRFGLAIGAVGAALVAAVTLGGLRIVREQTLRTQAETQERRTQSNEMFARMRSLLLGDRTSEALRLSVDIDASLLPPADAESLARIRLFWSDALMTPRDLDAYYSLGRVTNWRDGFVVRTQSGFSGIPPPAEEGSIDYLEFIRLPGDRMILRNGPYAFDANDFNLLDLRRGQLRPVAAQREQARVSGPTASGALLINTTGPPSDYGAQIREWNGALRPQTPAPMFQNHEFVASDCRAVVWIGGSDQTLQAFSSTQGLSPPAPSPTMTLADWPAIAALQSQRASLDGVQSEADNRVRRYTYAIGGTHVVITAASLTNTALPPQFPPSMNGAAEGAQFLERIATMARRQAWLRRIQAFDDPAPCWPRWEKSQRMNAATPMVRPDRWTFRPSGRQAPFDPPPDTNQSGSQTWNGRSELVSDSTGRRYAITDNGVGDRDRETERHIVRVCDAVQNARTPCRQIETPHWYSTALRGARVALLTPIRHNDFQGEPLRDYRVVDLVTLRPASFPAQLRDFRIADIGRQFVDRSGTNQALLLHDDVVYILQRDSAGAFNVVQQIRGIPAGTRVIHAPTANFLIGLTAESVFGFDLEAQVVRWTATMDLVRDWEDGTEYPRLGSSPDGKLLAVARDQETRIIDVHTGAPLTPWEPDLTDNARPVVDNSGEVRIADFDGVFVRAAPRPRADRGWEADCVLGARNRGGAPVAFDLATGVDAETCGYQPLLQQMDAAIGGRHRNVAPAPP